MGFSIGSVSGAFTSRDILVTSAKRRLVQDHIVPKAVRCTRLRLPSDFRSWEGCAYSYSERLRRRMEHLVELTLITGAEEE